MSLKSRSCLELRGQVRINTWLLFSNSSFWGFDCTALIVSCTLKKNKIKVCTVVIFGVFGHAT